MDEQPRIDEASPPPLPSTPPVLVPTPVSLPAPNAALMRSLGGLVRGLSCLFWGLPAALVVCFHTVRTEGLRSFGPVPTVVCTGLLAYGLWQLAGFQKQERVWRNALDLGMVLSLINLGLSPFLYWWSRVPGNRFFVTMVVLMVFSGLLFLAALNLVLRRLAAILPDEGLRQETRQFTPINFVLLALALLLTCSSLTATQVPSLPPPLPFLMGLVQRFGPWVVVFVLLLPLAMTMALIWKTKEVILENVFGGTTDNT